MKLWLDDERPPPEGWMLATTAYEALAVLEAIRAARAAGIVLSPVAELAYMSLDHDLADVHYEYFHAGQAFPKDHSARAEVRERSAKEMTGYDVLLWMAEHNVWPTEGCFVHTHNSARGHVMAGVINRYGPYQFPVRWTPYGDTLRVRLGRLTDQD